MLGVEPTDLWGALDIQSGEKSEKVSIQGETPAPQQPTHTRLLYHLTAVTQTIRQQLHIITITALGILHVRYAKGTGYIHTYIHVNTYIKNSRLE